MTMPMIDECHSPSFKDKLKSTISCFTCRSDDVERLGGGGNRRSHHTSPRSPCSWLKSSAQDLDIKDKCLGLIGKRGKNTRRRYNSADFRYDIASYALNFDDEIHREDDDNEMPLHSFSSRLPATPDRPSAALVGVRQARKHRETKEKKLRVANLTGEERFLGVWNNFAFQKGKNEMTNWVYENYFTFDI